jgi:hypothetical protein
MALQGVPHTAQMGLQAGQPIDARFNILEHGQAAPPLFSGCQLQPLLAQ